jgi:UDP-N-acetylglucosamine acyltransferase
MSQVPSARIHPTAVISPEAELADDVVVGPYVVIEGPVRVGPGCVLRPHATLCGPMTLGRGNTVFSGAVLGELPQHMKFDGSPTKLEIGDNNVFREGVTVHRGTHHTGTTRVGSRNFFMANSHVAHDCVVGDGCIFANGALVAGHCVLGDGVYLSGNSAVHQFSRIGRMGMLSGCSITTKDIPPFVIQQGINRMVGVNIVAMRRAGMPSAEINAVRRAFQVLFFEGQILTSAMKQVEDELGAVSPVRELLDFIHRSPKGVNSMRDHNREAA